MILINNEWYNTKDLSDISNIIREHFSYDLADEVDELVQSLKNDLDCDIEDLNIELSSLEDCLNDRDNEICKLREQVDELIEEIRDFKGEEIR